MFDKLGSMPLFDYRRSNLSDFNGVYNMSDFNQLLPSVLNIRRLATRL